MRNMSFHVLNIKMFLAIVDMQHSLHVLIMACEQSRRSFIWFFLYDFLCYSTALLSRMFIFLQLLPRLITLEFQVITLEFLIKQIRQPAGTPPFLQNLVASPVRHADLEQEDHWHYKVDRKRL